MSIGKPSVSEEEELNEEGGLYELKELTEAGEGLR
jgi:hypothetical protein